MRNGAARQTRACANGAAEGQPVCSCGDRFEYGALQVRYGPSVEISADSPEAAAILSDGYNAESRDTQAVVERLRREAQGSRVPVETVLDALFPPIVWREGDRLFVQHVSTAAADRVDVLKTREDLDVQLLERRASETGVCACRYDAILQCFDELIRQVAILCPERALLLLRVKDEIKLTISALEVLCKSSIGFSALKQIQSHATDSDVTQEQASASLEVPL
ncbi:33 kDa dynein arm light chain, axonemal, putative [Eimeria maxima]|uniref:33 kDa dynein arm light chain, axonemal, putative n=1 Tax=Eimeria maxima TaxID=5804 RepID=U6M1W0_EIMMA|nr:33 kDa dynein arm light chain, axonemal, putative [Eimeria maxima]CDJ56449.1 33 kDa dynein arm light chain, axonemal, putative [Eimeria maxima]